MASAAPAPSALLPPAAHLGAPGAEADDAITAAAVSAMGDLDITTAVVPLDGEETGRERRKRLPLN
jgi:hypothetical protein